ncbi:hypothetical protein O0L34_g15246 [Tuta absoluta]|nr:hypothetical protein O0L34_g15246 [Tuta absoluta]
MNNIGNYMDDFCVACLSSGRRLEPLTGAAWRYFQDIVQEALGTNSSDAVSVCWECAGGVRSALRLRRRVALAAAKLRHQKCLSETANSTNLGSLQSLSQLTCHINNTMLFMAHEEQTGNLFQDEVPGTPFIKLETKDFDIDEVEHLYVEDFGEPAVDDVYDHDLRAVIKSDLLKHKTTKDECTGKKKKTRHKPDVEQFNESDDEPLTVKKLKQENRKARGKQKKDDVVNGEGEDAVSRSRRRREYREQPAGVVSSERVRARLASLGVPPQALDMLVLTWDQVEAERVRMLSSEAYTRHEHRCAQCAVGFNQRAKLHAHMRKHDASSGDLECPACHIRCSAPHALAAHKRRHRVRWRCVVCGSLWSRAAVAADHAARAHGLALPTHVCPVCQHTASTLGKLRTHLKQHGGRARCPLPHCGKSLRDRASLRSHLQIHSGVKEHACPEPGCGKRFVFKKAMQLHATTHQQHQHLYCHQCDVTFKNQITLYHHMKYSLKHAAPDTFKHVCDECGRRFSSPTRLSEHRAAAHLHTAPVSCTMPGCSYACASRGGLRAHVRGVHRGQRAKRDHVCHTCGKAYTTKKTLEGHLRSHSGERPFRCAVCGAAFGYHAALYNHTRLVHNKHKLKRGRESPAVPPPAAAPAAPAPPLAASHVIPTSPRQ